MLWGGMVVINLLRHPKTFPTLLILLDILAAINYARVGNVKSMVYWLAAGTLSYCVTW